MNPTIIQWFKNNSLHDNHSIVMFSVLTLSAVDHGLKFWSEQTKDYKMGICCFSAKQEALRTKSKDWLDRNQDHVFEWSDNIQCE
jgi:hypothetical protein